MRDKQTCPLCTQSSAFFCADKRRRFFLCAQCGLLSADVHSHLSLAQEKAEYDLHNNDPNDPHYRAFLTQLLDPLKPHLYAGMQGLDYGCGPGPTLSVMLREQGVLMQDYDPFYAPHEHLVQQQYDLVTCTEVVEHFNTPRLAWQALRQCLRPGGYLGIMTWLVPSTTPEDFRRWSYKNDPSHVSFYQPQTLAWIGQQLGLSVHIHSERVVLMQAQTATASS